MTDYRKWVDEVEEHRRKMDAELLTRMFEVQKKATNAYGLQDLGNRSSSSPRPFPGLFSEKREPVTVEAPDWLKNLDLNGNSESNGDVGNVLKTPKRSYVPEVATSLLDSKLIINRVRKVDINIPNFPPDDQRTGSSRREVASGIQVHRVRPFERKAAPSDGYEKENGWHKDSAGDYRGFYRVKGLRFEGVIESRPSVSAPFKFFILDPPRSFLRGEHSACYHKQGRENGKVKYFIHFSRKPKDITTGITHVEMELARAIN